MRLARRIVLRLILLAALLLGALLLYGHARSHPEDLPWTPLDLSQPVGAFTGRKLADLAGEGPRCARLLERAGVRFTTLPPREAGPRCGYDHAVRLAPGGARRIAFRPADLGTRCAVAAALALWEWHVVQPAALRRFGQEVATIEHFGSYSCRRVSGRDEGRWSEHATANAVDVAGFVLADGTRVTVAAHWEAGDARGAFLRDARDGACGLFATVLSPEHDEAHRDHLHLDQAKRGAWGWRGCR